LWAELEREREMRLELCTDWADDHTHLQKLCMAAGCSEQEVEGDKYLGIPSIRDLVDLLSKVKLANMSYVRFENTLADLTDCYKHMDDEVSDREDESRKRLINLCKSISDEYTYDYGR